MTSKRPERRFITCRVDGLLLGVDISEVREISHVGEVTPVPSLPPAIHGVINLRGHLVTLVDLREALCEEPSEITASTVIVIVNVDGEAIGMIADCLSDVINVATEDIQPVPSHVQASDSRCASGVVELPEELLILVDLPSLLDVQRLTSAKQDSLAVSLDSRRGQA